MMRFLRCGGIPFGSTKNMWKRGVESEREMKNENSSFAKFRSTRDKRLSKTQGFVLFTDL